MGEESELDPVVDEDVYNAYEYVYNKYDQLSCSAVIIGAVIAIIVIGAIIISCYLRR